MCNTVVKIILFCITLLTLAIGAFLVAIPNIKGYKLNINFDEFEKTQFKDVPSKLLNIFEYNVIYISYLAYGIATIVTGLIGCFAISKNNCFARWLYCTITLVMAVVAGCSIYVSTMYHDDFFSQINNSLTPKNGLDGFQKIIIPKEYITQLQEIQDNMRCCGLITPRNGSDSCFGWSDPKRPSHGCDVNVACACQPKSVDFDKTCIAVESFEKKFGKNCAKGKRGFGNFNLITKKQGYVYGRGCLNVIWEWIDVSLFIVFGINVLATLATCWLCCFDNDSDKARSSSSLSLL